MVVGMLIRYGARRRICTLMSVAAVAAALVWPPWAVADEGMWTFDNVPIKQLKERYGFTPTPTWLDHVRLSTVRFNGGTGAFVSPNGLVITAHHIARGWLEELSSPQKDYVRDGFYARTQAEELRCQGMTVEVLISTQDVTARVRDAAKTASNDQEALIAQRAEIAKIEGEGSKATGLATTVVRLYEGGEYWLYSYKKYSDVRMVFAPEAQVAFFGGDPDNFVYPRFDLDFAFFRVYENGKPAKTPNFLKWNTAGAGDGELVFAAGHPGKTERRQTLAQLEFQRDYAIPIDIRQTEHRITALQRYSALGPEEARQAEGELVGYQTGLKLIKGWLAALLNSEVMAGKRTEEDEIRKLVEGTPQWKRDFGGAWNAIAEARKKEQQEFKYIAYRQWNVSRLPAIALAIVQYASEVNKPDAERLNGFHDAQLASMKSRILSPIFYPGLQQALLADSLEESLEELGPNDPFVQAALDGRSAADAARELVKNTKLFDVNFRKTLIEGGGAAVASSVDPMIVVARKIEPLIGDLSRWKAQNVDSVEAMNGEKIGKARFLAYGTSKYPDATSTLRLAYGTVRSYSLNGTIAPTKTTLFGLYDRAYSFDLRPPFDLPARYSDHVDRTKLSTPLNFISTCDIVGGSSGSPVINRRAEIVGVIFDTNIEGVGGRFVYNDGASRAVAVHSASIIEVLRKLYDAASLADEIEGTKSSARSEQGRR